MKHLKNFMMLIILSLSFTINAQEEVAGKIFMEGSVLYVVHPGIAVERFDLSSLDNIQSIGVVRVPGITDAVARGQYLFANSFEDLVLFKFDSETGDELELDRIENMFPEKVSEAPNSLNLAWFKTADEAQQSFITAGQSPPDINSGSMNALALFGQTVYGVNRNSLNTIAFDVTAPKNAMLLVTDEQQIGNGDLETASVNEQALYLGAQMGMHIFDLEDPEFPRHVSSYRHRRSCDPVAVQDEIAFITQRDGRDCSGTVNQLDVVDISNPNRPFSIAKYQLTNPHGLAIQQDLLLVCDGRDGLKVFDATNPKRLLQRTHLDGFFAYDVLYDPANKIAIVSVSNGFRLYGMENPSEPAFLGFIPITRL